MKQLMVMCLFVWAVSHVSGGDKPVCTENIAEDNEPVEIFGGGNSWLDPTVTTDGENLTEGDAEEAAEEDGADDNAGADNVIYKLTKGSLLDGSEGAPKPYDAKKILNAKYYFLCFTTVEFPEYRDTVKIRVIHNYNLIKKDFPDKVAFIFIPTCKGPEHLKKFLPELKLPFPILKRQVAEKSKLNSIRGRNNQFYAVVTADGKVVSAGGEPLKSNSDPGRMLRNFMDLLEEEGE